MSCHQIENDVGPFFWRHLKPSLRILASFLKTPGLRSEPSPVARRKRTAWEWERSLSTSPSPPTEPDSKINTEFCWKKLKKKIESGETFIACFHSVSHCDSLFCLPAMLHDKGTEKRHHLHRTIVSVMFMLCCLLCCESPWLHKQDSVLKRPWQC